ncbi:MAG: hypothetical protein HYY19_01930 [Candidatus Rokubacteria bacterium]|nr:hypothetical protein [Candidatus Rokubacteria bacterium]
MARLPRCSIALALVANFHAERGVMTARTFVLDTTVTAITGEGTIDFRDEILDLRLTARPRAPASWSSGGRSSSPDGSSSRRWGRTSGG